MLHVENTECWCQVLKTSEEYFTLIVETKPSAGCYSWQSAGGSNEIVLGYLILSQSVNDMFKQAIEIEVIVWFLLMSLFTVNTVFPKTIF